MNENIEDVEIFIGKRKINIVLEETDDDNLSILARLLVNELKNAHQVELESV